MRNARAGFVVITVLWFMVGIVSLAMLGTQLSRGAIGTVANRVALTRAEWRAEACLAAVLASHAALVHGDDRRHGRLHTLIGSADAVAACPGRVTVEPVGARLPINSAPESQLRRTLVAAGIPRASADSLTDALLDWRDADDSARTYGAEARWYARMGRRPPRNAPIADLAELRFVRGFEAWLGPDAGEGLDAILALDSARVAISVAPAAVLAGLPGFSAHTARLVERHFTQGDASVPELLAVAGILPSDERDALSQAYAGLVEAATIDPEGWRIRVRSSGVRDSAHAVRLTVDLNVRVMRDGGRLAIVDRRMTP